MFGFVGLIIITAAAVAIYISFFFASAKKNWNVLLRKSLFGFVKLGATIEKKIKGAVENSKQEKLKKVAKRNEQMNKAAEELEDQKNELESSKAQMKNAQSQLSAGADVRIMSANVLSYRWGEASYSNVLPSAQRAEIFAGVLLNYRPDATGLQETDEPWQQVLPWYLERMKEKDGVEYTCYPGEC